MKKRVVISGAGCVSALGLNLNVFSQNIFNGYCGIEYLNDPIFAGNSVKIGSRVKDFILESIDYDQKALARLDLFMAYGIKAGIEAIEASLLNKSSINTDRVGVFIGSGIGGLSTIQKQTLSFANKGEKGISPFFIPSSITNMASAHISIKYGYHGPNLATSTACTTGLHTILQSYDLIQNDYADVMIAGGAEHALSPLGIAGFTASRALSHNNAEPQKASRPFDKKRDGFVMGDGAAIVVLEEYEHALQRGAPILAEIIGGAYSGDAFHITQPHAQGYGAKLAMHTALKRAGLAAHDIDAVNPHATSTPIGDTLELEALYDVFGVDRPSKLWVFPTKGMTGHLLGAAGALESIICILALQNQRLPFGSSLEDPEDLCAHFQIPTQATAQPLSLNRIMNNSFGFGGSNASIIFQKAPIK